MWKAGLYNEDQVMSMLVLVGTKVVRKMECSDENIMAVVWNVLRIQSIPNRLPIHPGARFRVA
jgi:hypothetical protein